MRILIVGGSGFLGDELVRQSAAEGHVVAATCLTRPGTAAGADWLPLDIRDRAATLDLMGAFGPDVVVNAAYRQSDWVTTAVGAAHVAVATAAIGARLVHVSSDAVFSGKAITYAEDSVPDPATPYGAAKAAAEAAVQAITPTGVIARTSLIIGDGGSPHEGMVHALASGGIRGVLFTDDVRCPVHVRDLAAAVLELARSDRAGVHHVAGADAVSRYELGCLVARRDGIDPARLPYGRRAGSGLPGPLDVRLDCGLSQRHLKTRLRGAREFLS
ncbi:dTDP-4-dehydrorhamnose reductase [Microbispora rosea]|uniref:dTDP-4-dehydrorhamnose reductase n=1 Tax=Microbispora rosea TaxID=58117 RepID=A0A1N7EQC0_9ACTN|nr:sugar nucleotide-binding protein [Microbispora rosea]GIH52989.1 dTDP-4-dehydrorhamnose reductase [Microbispora rosea subsp. rosea]SIR90242.1 dTDP-4-dehydrorhamnose reductase [Microbispora rosea]